MTETINFRPHARLLTMLGEQLIKNDRIALVELVKNSYDADATIVEVDFQGFDQDGTASPYSSIVITDNGTGMTEQVVRGAWMNPATPSKLDRKRMQGRTPGGRVMQGEKGIGRFASFKLGSVVMLTTRGIGEPGEVSLAVDLSELDHVPDGGEIGKNLYLDEIGADISISAARLFGETTVFPGEHGTRIEVSALRSTWSNREFIEAFADLERMQPLMWVHSDSQAGAPAPSSGFQVRFLIDGVDQNLSGRRESEIGALFERAVLKVTNGRFDEAKRTFSFDLNERPVELSIDSPEVKGLRPFRDRFGTGDAQPGVACGPFEFEFYIFDFASTAPAQFQLDRAEKGILKQHRIYLYRDGIRVYPYGDPDDDWLQVDRIRGTLSARSMFSNDQALGYVSISQAENPGLQDKTNREGLIEAGRSSGDFIALIQTVLAYLRAKPYEQYAATHRRARERVLKERGGFDRELEDLIRAAELPRSLQQNLERLGTAVAAERELSKVQLARTQDLAGVGLSVETASHDLIAAGSESLRLARKIQREMRELGLASDPVFADMSSLVQRLEFVDSRFQDVQGLFVSTRQKRADLDIFIFLRRVRSMYAGLHRDKGITFEIDESVPLRAESTEAALLQCFINIVDNATFWLMTSDHGPRIIRAFAQAPATVILTDSGPGIAAEDAEFIFEPFYSGKGDDGKGLGLFIAREVGLRNGFTVDVTTSLSERLLPGASFSIAFDSGRV